MVAILEEKLLDAAYKGDYKEVEYLLTTYNMDVNCRYDYGWTPLQFACDKPGDKYVKTVTKLLQFGADPNLTNDHGDFPLLITVLREPRNVKQLLQFGANPNLKSLDPDDSTALIDACEFGGYTTVRLLLKFGADPNIQNSKGDTPLISIARQSQYEDISNITSIEIIKILFEYGAVDSPNKLNKTAVDVSKGVVKDFLTKKINFI